MNPVCCCRLCTILFLGFLVAENLSGFAPANEASSDDSQSPAPSIRPELSTDQARRQAELLHASMHSALQVVHDRFYREDEGLPIPAAVLSEVFRQMEADQNVKLRWLAVEGLAMNTDHLPRDAFEIEAVRILKSGKPAHEESQDGLYRRAAPVTLSNHCLKCHMPDRRSTRDRIAGLVITIPALSVVD